MSVTHDRNTHAQTQRRKHTYIRAETMGDSNSLRSFFRMDFARSLGPAKVIVLCVILQAVRSFCSAAVEDAGGDRVGWVGVKVLKGALH